MSRSTLQLLRWCNPVDSIISGALWMPLGDLNRSCLCLADIDYQKLMITILFASRALKTDFPVHGRPHTFGLPTIYRWLRKNYFNLLYLCKASIPFGPIFHCINDCCQVCDVLTARGKHSSY